jgi:hypothetical protein
LRKRNVFSAHRTILPALAFFANDEAEFDAGANKHTQSENFGCCLRDPVPSVG